MAIDFRDFVVAGFWPAILARSPSAVWIFFEIRYRFADAHVEDDLVDARHFHRVLVAELLDHRGRNGLAVLLLEPRLVGCLSHR